MNSIALAAKDVLEELKDLSETERATVMTERPELLALYSELRKFPRPYADLRTNVVYPKPAPQHPEVVAAMEALEAAWRNEETMRAEWLRWEKAHQDASLEDDASLAERCEALAKSAAHDHEAAVKLRRKAQANYNAIFRRIEAEQHPPVNLKTVLAASDAAEHKYQVQRAARIEKEKREVAALTKRRRPRFGEFIARFSR